MIYSKSFCCLVANLCPILRPHGRVALQAPLSMEFPGKNTGAGCISFSKIHVFVEYTIYLSRDFAL